LLKYLKQLAYYSRGPVHLKQLTNYSRGVVHLSKLVKYLSRLLKHLGALPQGTAPRSRPHEGQSLRA
jgi:hypothetical protein